MYIYLNFAGSPIPVSLSISTFPSICLFRVWPLFSSLIYLFLHASHVSCARYILRRYLGKCFSMNNNSIQTDICISCIFLLTLDASGVSGVSGTSNTCAPILFSFISSVPLSLFCLFWVSYLYLSSFPTFLYFVFALLFPFSLSYLSSTFSLFVLWSVLYIPQMIKTWDPMEFTQIYQKYWYISDRTLHMSEVMICMRCMECTKCRRCTKCARCAK